MTRLYVKEIHLLISVPAEVSGQLMGLFSRMKALEGIILKPSICLIAHASVPSLVFSRHLAEASRHAESMQGMLLDHLALIPYV